MKREKPERPKAEQGVLLVVDDNEMNRDMLGRRMRRAGYEVVLAETGRQALEIIDKRTIDLVLLDIEMPEMDGIEVLQTIRRTRQPSQLPVIMVTARSQSEDVVQALSAGANDYVTKPVDVPVALARVEAHIALKRAERAVRESEERYALAARGANDGLWDWDLQSGRVYLSPRWFSILDIEGECEDNPVETWLDRVHPADVASLKEDIATHIEGRSEHFENEHRLRHRSKEYLWVVARGLAIRDDSGRATRMAGSLTDVTSNKVVDPVTALPNRVLLQDRVERCIERARRREESRFAVLLIDVDRFQAISSTLGPGVADQLLRGIAERLKGQVRAADTLARNGASHTVARLGGSEFVLLLEDIRAGDVDAVAQRVLDCLAEPFDAVGREIHLSVSAGIVEDTSSRRSAEELLSDADTALQQSKELGGGRVVVFEPAMRERAVTRMDLENDLRRVVERRQLRTYYQPIISLDSGAIGGFEALARWHHPDRGIVSPAQFIPLAEETGLIVPIGLWILREAWEQVGAWNREHAFASPLWVSVNLSGRQLAEPNLVEQIRSTVGVPQGEICGLELEITESVLVQSEPRVISTLDELRASGVKIAIDDFGTGYSSFAYLQDLPADSVKIDRSFVSKISPEPDSAKIVRTIVELAHKLGMEVIAEGVETAHQLRQLIDMGCGLAQGFRFSRPIQAEDARDMLLAGKIDLRAGEVTEKV